MDTLTFDDFDEFCAAVRDVDHEMILQNLVRRYWRIQHVDVADIHIQKGEQGSGDINVGRSRADGYLIVLPVRHAPLHSANGVMLQSNSVVILEPGCDYCLSTSGDHEWCSVFIPSDKLTGLSDHPPGRCHVVQPTTGLFKRYLRLVRRIVAAAQIHPDIVSSAAISDALLDLRRMSSRLVCDFVDPPASPVGRPRIPRAEILRRIKLLLESRENQPLSSGEMVQAAGVSERTLRDVFRQYVRVSPRRYLQLRQLHHVNRALRAAEPDSDLVSQVLVQFGVWEFGRFATRYRDAFGELPSETLGGRTSRQ